MKRIRLIIRTDIKNIFSSWALPIIWYSITVFLVAGLAVLFGVLLISPELDKVRPDRESLHIYLGIILFSASLLGLGVNLNSMGFAALQREKSRGNIQSLLVTTLRLKEIWMGKSLAVFIPGFIAGVLLTLITLFTVNYMYFVPAVGFLLNPWILAICLIIFPALYLFLGMLVNLIGLTGKPVNANIIAQVFLPLFVNIVIQLPLRTDLMDYTSWPFLLANTVLVLIIAAVVAFLQSRITKEKVVLSY